MVWRPGFSDTVPVHAPAKVLQHAGEDPLRILLDGVLGRRKPEFRRKEVSLAEYHSLVTHSIAKRGEYGNRLSVAMRVWSFDFRRNWRCNRFQRQRLAERWSSTGDLPLLR